ncbi:hypothetical protein [Nocardia sp. NBC_01730]|uniref:hypothetical protein n=1 Tax=Nocardia sp. NBC_01730 TaxID=2975998 RepID=UPI002E155363
MVTQTASSRPETHAATDTRTGQAVDLHPHITDKRTLMRALRASAGLPILAGR